MEVRNIINMFELGNWLGIKIKAKEITYQALYIKVFV